MGICRSSSLSMLFAKLVNPLLCIIISLALIYAGQQILKPIVFAALGALLLVSPCRFFERQGFPRGIAALICLLLGLIVFVVVFYFISHSIASFRKDLPMMVQNIDQSINELEEWAQRSFHLSKEDVQQFVQNSTDKVIPSTSAIVNTTVTTVTGIFFLGIIIFIITFLLLLYRALIVSFFVSLFDEKYTDRIHLIFDKTRFVVRSYLVGLVIEMLIVAVAYCSVLFLLGVRYALLLGVIGAILNIIPYLGIFMACILSTLITLTTNSPSTVVWVVISLIIIHMLDSNILMTRIVGSKVKLNALTTIVGVITGSALWGIPGTFMAVPIMAILKVAFEEIGPLKPFALLMGEDKTVKSVTRPALNRLAGKMRARGGTKK